QYQLDPTHMVLQPWMRDYFEELKVKHGIDLTPAQQAWYLKKQEVLQDDMKREYPSTPDEAFAQSTEGAYYQKQMRFLRKGRRITTTVAYNPQLPVVTAWDLGMSDAMSIWFAQVNGREIHLIDYLEDSGEGIEYYAHELRKKGYQYSFHFGPHDLAVRELSANGKTRQEVAAQHGIRFEIVPRISNQAEGIQAVRQFLPQCFFAEEACARGVDCLDNYRKEWDDRLGVFKDRPRHDWASHGAKAFETLARSDLFQLTSATSVPQSMRPAQQQRSGWGGHI
ncbi:MAG: terminase, partial [Marinobacterium sp.]|nr:terminase [Marinobacterium sp.]